VFEKLHKYLGKAIRALVERPDEEHVLRLHRNRVYYVRADLMRKATNVRGCVDLFLFFEWSGAPTLDLATTHPSTLFFLSLFSPTQVARDKLVHLGQCIGKLTHSGKFRLTVGSLDLLAQHAKYKVSESERERERERERTCGRETRLPNPPRPLAASDAIFCVFLSFSLQPERSSYGAC
jgi:60S ribosome subunit biogenesis protein NIP7